MSENDRKDRKNLKSQSGAADARASDEAAEKHGSAPAKTTREDRLAEALRANLRRRKSAAKSRKDG
ncbi:hypothetical protein WNZ15_18975 [Roseibium sp. AS2]|uniref:hypothetical protein n=1 Tax=Roseibium sp. AS2 TaxID=3135781 RepID=UPI00317DC0E8